MSVAGEIDQVMQKAQVAFLAYKKCSLEERANFMREIGEELANIRADVVPLSMEEAHLSNDRMDGELNRTIYQLNNYAKNAAEGSWLDVRINKGVPNEDTDIRKMMVPLGPVVVFGASNFPFAYSTAGGDTACAFAAGCPVVVKGHPAHIRTSEMVGNAIQKAAQKCDMPEHIFQHVSNDSFDAGQELVKHSLTKAVGFTGSLGGGRALFDLANQRENPIPVFSEMGSVNPVFLMPDKLQESTEDIALMYADSITQSVGQFCTNPGLIFGIEGSDLEEFISTLSEKIKRKLPESMLHDGIAKAFLEKKKKALAQQGVEIEAVAEEKEVSGKGMPTIASTTGELFLKNKTLHQEVFGPYSLVIKCKDLEQMQEIIAQLEGQLTSTLMATEKDVADCPEILERVQEICGRLIMNGVPTGVTVCTAMHHGGPYPATTDSRFTSVGADGIRRFARPLCYQNFSNLLLPDELKNENPLGIWRMVNDVMTKDVITS
ncbi:MAG TPA: aldehyde dehydrogenase (NADP(+)) [Chitinophagaceae bacterium]|nr:aldehyde dehydrogenase (NADP(+)) [Chitinophagaceae bacterium]